MRNASVGRNGMVLWLSGIGFSIGGCLIQFLPVAAAVVFVINLVNARRATTWILGGGLSGCILGDQHRETRSTFSKARYAA
jgi:hypothetical protein